MPNIQNGAPKGAHSDNKIIAIQRKINFKKFTNTCINCMYRISNNCTKYNTWFTVTKTSTCDQHQRKFNKGKE